MPAPSVKISAAARGGPWISGWRRFSNEANDIRTARAKLKKELEKAETGQASTRSCSHPSRVRAHREGLRHAPRRSHSTDAWKTNGISLGSSTRISPSKGIGGLSQGERGTELVDFAASLARPLVKPAISRRPRSRVSLTYVRTLASPRSLRPTDLLGFRGRFRAYMSKVFRNHWPVWSREGVPVAWSCCSASQGPSSSRSERPPGSRGRGRRTGSTTTSSGPRNSPGVASRTISSSFRHLQRQPLRDAFAPRSKAGSAPASSVVVLWIRGPGCQGACRADLDSIQIFIAPPDPAVLRERLAGRGLTPSTRSTSALRRPKSSSPRKATSTI